jgi:hypothetical protein
LKKRRLTHNSVFAAAHRNAGWPQAVRHFLFWFWGAQAASLFISAACRDAFSSKVAYATSVAGKLPATAGWQPALPNCNPPSSIYNPQFPKTGA